MKPFSVIFSIYLLGLIFIPCADVHAENNHQTTSIYSSVDSHGQHADRCSPFCLCNCCQTVTQPAIYTYFSHFATLTGTSVPFIISREFSISIILWRPPKV